MSSTHFVSLLSSLFNYLINFVFFFGTFEPDTDTSFATFRGLFYFIGMSSSFLSIVYLDHCFFRFYLVGIGMVKFQLC